MGEVIQGKFNHKVTTMKTVSAINAAINSYEEWLLSKIKAADWRAEGYQQSNDWHEAEMEITRAEAFREALCNYELWGLCEL